MRYPSILQMSNIAILILDESHHTAANHAYAVIMEAFYHARPLEVRPKVLGLTASPNNPLQLQEMLSSKLSAPSDL